ncbi:RdgB/HAM1 family non-canonical purine NTP pyrophosphatase [Candidatus Margulisiibacteriota bacterium]
MAKKKRLVIATKNKGKVREIKHLLKNFKVKVISLLDMPKVPDIKETAKTFKGNAIKKAKTIARKFNSLVLADDSGLQVKSLRNHPGVKSARYAGPNPTTNKLCGKLLREMKAKKDRKARFVCVIAVADAEKVRTVKGICSGKIGYKMKGTQGFGYDPVFIPGGATRTFAQMPLKIKNKISHRGKALQKAKKLIKKFI